MATVLGTGLLGACDPGTPPSDGDDEQTLEQDFRAASHGTDSLDGTPGFVHIGNLFVYTPGWNVDPTDADAVRRDAVTSVHNRLALTFAVLGCEPDLQSDDDQQISLTMQGCRLMLWEIDADVVATARVEQGACDTGECPLAVVWDLDVGELRSGLVGFPKNGFAGPLEIRAPLDPAEPMQWTTHPGFVIETGLGLRFDTLSTASWRVREDNCIEMDMGARLALEEREDEIDERVGDLVISARGLERCPGQCAHAGEVQISFGAGQVIGWTHDAQDTITVVGPRGREVEVTPPCAEQRPDGG